MRKMTDNRIFLLSGAVVALIVTFVAPFLIVGFLAGPIIGILAGIGFLAIAAYLLIYFVLAPNNCCFTFVNEATAKFIMRMGKFEKCLIQWEGHTFDYSKDGSEKWKVIDGKEKHLLGGLRFYGVWPFFDVHIYEFRWVGVTEDGKEQPKTEWLDSILVRDDVYLCKVTEAEDKDSLPLDLQVFLTIRIANPYKAKFDVQRWLEAVLNRTQPLIREYVAQLPYTELLQKRNEVGGKMWKKLEEAELIGEDGEFFKRYGVDVRKLEVRQINPPKDLREDTLRKYKAQRQAEADITKAEADREVAIIHARAEAQRLERVYKIIDKFGDIGKLIRTLEAVEKSSLAASLTIQAVPGLSEVLRGTFGKPTESITSQELKELRETVQKISEKIDKEQKSKKHKKPKKA